MTEGQTDRQLVEEVLHGRTDAFNLLVWRWQRPLFNFLLRCTGDRELAQDLCQDTFLRAYVQLKDLREKEKFASWLFRIAVNLYRSDQRRASQRIDGSVQQMTDNVANGPVSSGTREIQLTLRALISRLSPEHREVLLLKVYHGFRFDEMATILDCPVSTLKSRLYKAFELLRSALESQKPSSGS